MKSKKTVLLPKHQLIIEELGENIKLARKRRKLTTVQVCERADIHRSTLHWIESGKGNVSIGSYLNVLKIFNLHTDLLEVAKDDIFGRKLQDLDLLSTEENKELDEVNKLDYNLRNQLNVALKRGSFSKSSLITDVIGCSFENLKFYLEDNPYGFKVNGQELDIDHIIPTSTARNKKQIKKLNHYKNLQLLPTYYNRHVKSDLKWDKEVFEKWFEAF